MRHARLALLSAIVFVFVLGAVALRSSVAEIPEPPLELTSFDIDLDNDPLADLLIAADASPFVHDDFDRPDRPGLGKRNDGVRWTDLGNWRVADGSARLAAVTSPDEPYLAITQGPAGERMVKVEMATMGGGAGLVFAYRDASDYWAVVATPAFASWQVWRVVDGEAAVVASLRLATIADGTEVAVHITDTSLEVFLDSRSYARLATSVDADATLAGLIALRPSDAAWDAFAIATPAPAR